MSTEGSTCPWIASDRVEGTAVYGPDKERMGSIKRLMIDNTTGYVAYADLNFGGFLGIGNHHYPIPWSLLRYDTDLGGYRTDVSGNRLRGSPKHGSEDYDWSAKRAKLDDYYNDEVIESTVSHSFPAAVKRFGSKLRSWSAR